MLLRALIASGRQFDVAEAVYIVIAAARAYVRGDHQRPITDGRISLRANGDVDIVELPLDTDYEAELRFVAPELIALPRSASTIEEIDAQRIRISVAMPSTVMQDWSHAAVYSLGRLLDELLAGCQRPASIDAVTRKAVAVHPSDRYADPHELATALADVLATMS